jgi:Tfp pilus assembly protein PilF
MSIYQIVLENYFVMPRHLSIYLKQKINPKYLPAYIKTALVFKDLKQDDLAITELFEGLKINPNSYDVLSNLAVIYALKKNHSNALNFFKKALETGRADATFFSNYGSFCSDIGNRIEAINAHLKSAEIDPANNGSFGRALHQKMLIADWVNIDSLNDEIVRRLKLNQDVV